MTYSNSRSVPFEIPNVTHGIHLAKGIMKAKKEGIELEYEIQDVLFGITHTDVQTVFLSYDKIQEVRFKKGWFSAKVIIEANSMKDVKSIPQAEQASVTLKIKRKHREEAEQVISQARLQLSENKLSQLDDGNTDY
ncbi:hypothetical protein [Fodinibius halophilus]|uniref:Uncharacterized protein n=1 Tax=Fodinibius halophilus TaxID=1736908 RepID=A0A6M1TGA2_9BACT|nr:hypothetical protein [Fodinibius halophilus]NGP89824.1 hypothetical protein [Fodinibius halophilus]